MGVTYKQIIPADGWCAVYAVIEPDESGQPFYVEALAVWVLCEERGITYVAGLTAEDITWETNPTDSEAFVCYAQTKDVELHPLHYGAHAAATAQRVYETRAKQTAGGASNGNH